MVYSQNTRWDCSIIQKWRSNFSSMNSFVNCVLFTSATSFIEALLARYIMLHLGERNVLLGSILTLFIWIKRYRKYLDRLNRDLNIQSLLNPNFTEYLDICLNLCRLILHFLQLSMVINISVSLMLSFIFLALIRNWH